MNHVDVWDLFTQRAPEPKRGLQGERPARQKGMNENAQSTRSDRLLGPRHRRRREVICRMYSDVMPQCGDRFRHSHHSNGWSPHLGGQRADGVQNFHLSVCRLSRA